ncbi:hypothetical protein QRX25_14685 [Bacillus sp. L381]|nr:MULTISPECIES: hypothetical protein [Bacillus]MCR9040849.1 hypothetical protein [Bacillus velezensis]QUN08731.1 hypothetical protein KEF49_14490 [Bacillus amyloliquefaciens]QYM81803.1 hypothetical protein KTJ85_14335 [Bacillus sp. 7D3]WIX20848.1 hypothetical protein QRX25_14685 [Bacillus sp. L381]
MINDRLAYLDRLISVQNCGHNVHEEIDEAIALVRSELREGQSKHEGDLSTGYDDYIENIKRLAGDWYSDEFRLTNAVIYGAYSSGGSGDIYVGRAQGTSTSIWALEATFKDVVYLTIETQRNAPNLNGKVVFIDPGVSVPRGQRIKRLLKIVSIEDVPRHD